MNIFNAVVCVPETIGGSVLTDIFNQDLAPGERHSICRNAHLTSALAAAVLVASVAGAVLGVAVCIGGSAAAVLAVPEILVSIPLAYLTYNGYCLFDNIGRIAEDPGCCRTVLSGDISRANLRRELSRGMIACDWLAHIIVDKAIENGRIAL